MIYERDLGNFDADGGAEGPHARLMVAGVWYGQWGQQVKKEV